MSKIPTNLRLDPEVRASLEAEALKTGGSMTSVVEAALAKAETVPKAQGGPMAEIGVSGLRATGGFIYEEFLPNLRGDRILEVYREMQANDPVVRAVMFAVNMLMRQVRWFVTPGGEDDTDEAARELVETALYDMSQSWEDTLTEVLSMLPFGWSYHELVYKRRNGGNPLRPGVSSQFTDGRIGWRKWAIRGQTTRWKWVFDDDGGLRGMWQQDYYAQGGTSKGQIFIPIEKALLFRPEAHKNNPEGMSVLRAAYRPWWFKKRIEEIEAIGAERDLAGYPVMRIPGQEIADATSSYTAAKQAIRNIRRNEQEGAVLSSDRDPVSGEYLVELSLLNSGGRRQFQTNEIIQRYNKQIAMTMLADFIFLGQDSVGSFALASNKTSIFAMALGAWLDSIAAVVNRHAIPRLLALNGIQVDQPPSLQHGDIETADPQKIGDAISKLTASGMPLWGGPDGMELENWARNIVGAPEITDEDFESRRGELDAKEAAEAAREERDRDDRLAAAAAAQGLRDNPPEPVDEEVDEDD